MHGCRHGATLSSKTEALSIALLLPHFLFPIFCFEAAHGLWVRLPACGWVCSPGAGPGSAGRAGGLAGVQTCFGKQRGLGCSAGREWLLPSPPPPSQLQHGRVARETRRRRRGPAGCAGTIESGTSLAGANQKIIVVSQLPANHSLCYVVRNWRGRTPACSLERTAVLLPITSELAPEVCLARWPATAAALDCVFILALYCPSRVVASPFRAVHAGHVDVHGRRTGCCTIATPFSPFFLPKEGKRATRCGQIESGTFPAV
jgi:hypothetical protein